jgi:hypothetical protein
MKDAVDRALATVVLRATSTAGKQVKGVRVTVDGEAVSDDGAPVEVDPGEHTFRFSADGYELGEAKMRVRSAERDRVVSVVLRPVSSSLSSGPGSSSSGPSIGGDPRTLGYVVGAAGIASLAVGTLFVFLAQSSYDDALSHCPAGPSSCDDTGVSGGQTAHRQAAIATVAFVVGAGALAGGVVLVVVGSRNSGSSVRVSAGAQGIRVGGAW